MEELNFQEIDQVNGGAILLIAAAAVIAASVGVGMYIGYHDAKAAAKK